MKTSVLSKFDRLMAAVTFAEENEHTTAREFLQEEESQDRKLSDRPELWKQQPLQESRS
ncbi:MAG: hypothetical protein HZB31_05430 [Nitrospirae bacterium]|nr:hypothetical protein [Nitrospirota bacterium]